MEDLGQSRHRRDEARARRRGARRDQALPRRRRKKLRHVPGNGPNSADGLSGIDLGQNNGNNAGNNTFINNTDAGICVEPKPALAATANSLKAQGNVFRASGGDCTAGGTYVRASACEESGADYAGACAGAADLDGCAPSNTCE